MATDPFIFRSRVRFVDTDATGRIHYSALFRHFEAAETEFFRFIGFPYTDIEDRKIGYPRVHVEADYLASIRADDELEIEVGLERVGARSATLYYDVRCRGAQVARGRIVIASMDRSTQKSCPLPDPLASKLKDYLR